jgi:hypothetical protein
VTLEKQEKKLIIDIKAAAKQGQNVGHTPFLLIVPSTSRKGR